MSLYDFCEKYNYDVNETVKKLKTKGITAKQNQSIKEIAVNNKVTPEDIINIITK
jgi:chorismate mutase